MKVAIYSQDERQWAGHSDRLSKQFLLGFAFPWKWVIDSNLLFEDLG